MREQHTVPTSPSMTIAAKRYCLLALGVLLIILAGVVAPIPGPGGVFLFAGGAVLLLRNSAAVRRWFARGKRRWPRMGGLIDRVLRRPSALRRRALERTPR